MTSGGKGHTCDEDSIGHLKQCNLYDICQVVMFGDR